MLMVLPVSAISVRSGKKLAQYARRTRNSPGLAGSLAAGAGRPSGRNGGLQRVGAARHDRAVAQEHPGAHRQAGLGVVDQRPPVTEPAVVDAGSVHHGQESVVDVEVERAHDFTWLTVRRRKGEGGRAVVFRFRILELHGEGVMGGQVADPEMLGGPGVDSAGAAVEVLGSDGGPGREQPEAQLAGAEEDGLGLELRSATSRRTTSPQVRFTGCGQPESSGGALSCGRGKWRGGSSGSRPVRNCP